MTPWRCVSGCGAAWVAGPRRTAGPLAWARIVIEKTLERHISAPVADVFDRLVDLRAYADWLPETSAPAVLGIEAMSSVRFADAHPLEAIRRLA